MSKRFHDKGREIYLPPPSERWESRRPASPGLLPSRSADMLGEIGGIAMRLSAFFTALFVVTAPAVAQQGSGFEWKLNDQTAPPSPAQASKDGFGVLMLVTDDSKAFLEAWQGSTPPHVITTERAIRGNRSKR
jgi:hypothetical protein